MDVKRQSVIIVIVEPYVKSTKATLESLQDSARLSHPMSLLNLDTTAHYLM